MALLQGRSIDFFTPNYLNRIKNPIFLIKNPNSITKNQSFFAFSRNLSIKACFESKRIELRNNVAFSTNGSINFKYSNIENDRKIAVAVDVDEVLGNFISALNKFVLDRYSANHSVSEYYVYEFFRIWNCTCDEADARVHEFFKTPYFKKGIHPIPGALRALQRVSSFCNLSVVTSRQNAIKDDTIQWIENHYPGLFQEIHFGNHFALEGKSRPKSDICRSLGAKVLIDDNPKYAMECAEAGIKVLLFDYEKSYPWCKIESVQQHPLVTKVHNWEEVEHQLVTKALGFQMNVPHFLALTVSTKDKYLTEGTKMKIGIWKYGTAVSWITKPRKDLVPIKFTH